MKLLTVGDSFTFGEELSDVTDNVTPSKFAWPYLLANKLGYEVTNLARPGSGNTRMIRHVVESARDFDLIVTAWTHFARIEIADDTGIFDTWPGSRSDLYPLNSPWRKEIIEYITKHHNDTYLFHQYLINVILTQDYLKQHNKRYIMLDTFDNETKDKLKLQTQETQLIKQIDTKNFLSWPDETMMDWTYGSPIGPRGHFLEQGHEIVADKIYEHIRHLGWIS